MKSTQKIKRVQLKINCQNEFFLLGIVSADPDYKISLILNRMFNISLKNTSPLKVTNDNGSEYSFSRFTDQDSSSEIIFTLISNRSGNNYFIKKLKNVDFIFQVHHPDYETINDHYISEIRSIESVTAVFNIEFSTIKDKFIQYLIQ